MKNNKNDNIHKNEFKVSDDYTNINKYKISCKYYRISYYIKINLTTSHYYKLLWFRESLWNLQVKEKRIIQIGPETMKLDCCVQVSHFGKVLW